MWRSLRLSFCEGQEQHVNVDISQAVFLWGSGTTCKCGDLSGCLSVWALRLCVMMSWNWVYLATPVSITMTMAYFRCHERIQLYSLQWKVEFITEHFFLSFFLFFLTIIIIMIAISIAYITGWWHDYSSDCMSLVVKKMEQWKETCWY